MPEASKNLNEQALRGGFDIVVGGPASCPKTAEKPNGKR